MAGAVAKGLSNLGTALSATQVLPMVGINNPLQKELDLYNFLNTKLNTPTGDYAQALTDLSKGNYGNAYLNSTPIGNAVSTVQNLPNLFTDPTKFYNNNPVGQSINAVKGYLGFGKRGRKRGGAMQGRSPVSSDPNTSKSLDVQNVMRTLEQAEDLYKQATQIQQAMAPWVERLGINKSWIGLGKKRRMRGGASNPQVTSVLNALDQAEVYMKQAQEIQQAMAPWMERLGINKSWIGLGKRGRKRGGANFGRIPLSSSAVSSGSMAMKNALRTLSSLDDLYKEGQALYTTASPYIAGIGALGAVTGLDKYLGFGKKPRNYKGKGSQADALKIILGMFGGKGRGGASGGVCGGASLKDMFKPKSAYDLYMENPITTDMGLSKFVERGVNKMKLPSVNKLMGLGKKSDGRQARAQIVRQVMQERGVSLPQASKIVKAEGLY
jgi:hypothetical protein